MTATATKDADLETWENSTAGRVVLKRFNQTGALDDVMYAGHKRFHLTPQERRINQELAASSEQDVFQNGICQPITLNSSEADTAALLANPNVLSEAAMKALFKASTAAFADRLQSITHVAVLNRLLDMSREVDATLSQFEVIQGRLDEVAPLLATEITSASDNADTGRPSRPVTPR